MTRRLHPGKGLTAALLLTLALAGPGAAAQAPESVRPELGKPLVAAQALLKAGRYQEALAALRDADAVTDRTPYERYILERLRGAAAAGAGDDATMSRAFEAVLASGRVERAEGLRIIEALAGKAFRAKDYPKAVEWCERHARDGGSSSPQMATLCTSALYQSGDHAGVVKSLQPRLREVDPAAPVLDEPTLRMLAASYTQLGDEAGYLATLEKLLQRHPNQAYWAEALARLPRQPHFSDRLMLDLLRLKLATGPLGTADHYLDLAQLAMLAGLPAEAGRVLQAGHDAGLLGNGPDAARHQRLQAVANQQAAEDDRMMASEAAGLTGDAMFATGMVLASAGKAGKGLELMAQGLAKGGLRRPDEARLRYGQALLASGRKLRAIEVFKTVRGGEGLADLGRLWVLHAEAVK